MKIAFANRADALINRGGDTTQMMLTRQHLESRYHLQISLCLRPEELMETDCDIVHIFNVQTSTQTREFIKVALKKNIKIVLSPIYWNLNYSMFQLGLSHYHLFTPRSIYQMLSYPASKLYNFAFPGSYMSRQYKAEIKYLIENADAVLPNSTEEWNIVKEHFKIPDQFNYSIIPNAIELSDYAQADAVDKVEKSVLQVGVISPSKNQLGTLLALIKRPEIPIYFIGRISDNAYYKYVLKKAEKRGNVFFIDEMTHKDLISQYKKATVHVLPSFRESPGLVTLEAFQFGCEIVVADSRFVPVNYYRFNEIAHICNPYEIHSIRTAIDHAFTEPKQTKDMKDAYFSFFNYENVADLTYQAYQSLL